MTAVQQSRRFVAGIAALLLAPVLLLRPSVGDGVWLLAVIAVGAWAASSFRVVRQGRRADIGGDLRDVEAGLGVDVYCAGALGRIEAYYPDDALAAVTRALLVTVDAPGGGS
jgi:hypothetical protein